MTKTGTIAGLYFSVWLYRFHSQGGSLSSKRALVGVALFLVSFAVALAWQGVSKVKFWSWWMTFLGFGLSLGVVSIALVVVVRLIV
jgi:hypothetical protein